MTTITRRHSLGLIAGAIAAPSLVRAQGAWAPSRTITMVVP